MRINICMPDAEGNFKVLCGFETEHLGEEIADDLARYVGAMLLEHPEVCFKDLVVMKWEGDTNLIDKDEVDLQLEHY